MLKHRTNAWSAGLGPDPYGVRRSETGSLLGPSSGGGLGSSLRSRSHSIVPASASVARRRLGSRAGVTGSSEDDIPGAL